MKRYKDTSTKKGLSKKQKIGILVAGILMIAIMICTIILVCQS